MSRSTATHHMPVRRRSRAGAFGRSCAPAGPALALAFALVLCVGAGVVWADSKLLPPPPTAAAQPGQTPVSISMHLGQSHILACPRLRRVAVMDVKVADVTVPSSRELLICAKGLGNTDLYIWDASGLHKIAISVFDVTPSEEMMVRLRPLLGPQYRFVALSDSALAVEGAAGNAAEAERISRLIAGLGPDVKVISLVSVPDVEPREAPLPVEHIAKALGDAYKVSAMNAETVLVEGRAGTPEDAARARAVLDAFKTQAKIVDLIEAPAPSAPPARTIEDERQLVADALGDGVTVRTVGGQAIAVEGRVASDQERERVAQALDSLDLTAPVLNMLTAGLADVQQVMVRVKVVEVDRQQLDRLGVNWGHLSRQATTTGGSSAEQIEFFDQPFMFGQVARKGFEQLFDLGVQLNLLIENNLARILAEPNILVNDGEKASILVGGEVPIPVPQAGIAGAAAITIEYKEFGVRLSVTPAIVGDGGDKIHLSLVPEVSSIDDASSITVSGLRVPGFRTRRAETTVTVASGDTLAIAGLLQRDIAKNVRKIPILGDIPILGNLFRSKQFTEGKTDLVIMVTPEIHTGSDDDGGQ